MGRADLGGGELEVLDPVTGEAVAGGGRGGAAGGPRRGAAARRRLRVAVGLALLSVVCGVVAAQRAVVISSVRALDRTWAEAMALDRARAEADATVFELSRASLAEGRAAERAQRAALGRIGSEVAPALLALEDDLRRQWIVDDRVDATRDAMVEALEFRRFQLDPTRRLLGDTPLRRVEELLAAQRDRFGLRPAAAPVPALRSEAEVREDLRRFADVTTATVVVGLREGRWLDGVDVDASSIDTRSLTSPGVRLVAAGDLALVETADGTVTAYEPDVSRPLRWTVPGTGLVAGRPGGDALAWVRRTGGVVPLAAEDGSAGGLRPLADDLTLRADLDAGLLVEDVAGGLHLHDAATGARVRSLPLGGRFVGASSRFVAVQRPGRPVLAVLLLADGRVQEVPLPRTDAGQVVASPTPELVLAFAAGPLAGNVASMLTVRAEGSWALRGLDGPRATVEPGTVAWSPDGTWLFWTTPEGRIAVGNQEAQALLRADLEGVEQLVTFPARR